MDWPGSANALGPGGPAVTVGLYYYRLRYYDPAAGRFVSRDPLGLWGDPGQNGNGQSYCGNNPVNRVDPLGLGDVDIREAERAAQGGDPGARERLADKYGRSGDSATRELARLAKKRAEHARERDRLAKRLAEQRGGLKNAKRGGFIHGDPSLPSVQGEIIDTEGRLADEDRALGELDEAIGDAIGDDAELRRKAGVLGLLPMSDVSVGHQPGLTDENGIPVPTPVREPLWITIMESFNPLTCEWTITTTWLEDGCWYSWTEILRGGLGAPMPTPGWDWLIRLLRAGSRGGCGNGLGWAPGAPIEAGGGGKR